MTEPTKLNGNLYFIPDVGNINWGQNVTNFLLALGAGTNQNNGGVLQKGFGGTTQQFTLLGNVDFGATYGLISSYFESRQSNAASTGVLRLSVGDTIDWRNNANTGNLVLGVDGSDHLVYNGTIIGGGFGSVTQVVAGAGLSGGTITTTGTIAVGVGTGLLTSGSILNVNVDGTSIIAGTGIGNPLIANVDNVTIVRNSGGISLGTSGVSAGTYGNGSSIPQLVIDSYGRVTFGTSLNINAGFIGSSQITGSSALAFTGTSLGVVVDGSTITNVSGTLAAPGGTATLTKVVAGLGLTGGTITTSGTIAIGTTGVTAGTYGNGSNIPQVIVNAEGQLTSVSNVSVSIPPGTAVVVAGGSNITVGTNTVGTSTTYTVNGSPGTLTNVATGTGLTGGPVTTTGTVSVASQGITYALMQSEGTKSLLGNPNGTAQSPQEITLGANLTFTGTTLAVTGLGTGSVTSITAGTGLSGGTITTSGTIAIGTTGVTAGTYGNGSNVSQIIVNTQGQITSASNVAISAAGLVPFVAGHGTASAGGLDSFAAGGNSSALGPQSIAIGTAGTASGTGSIVIGQSSVSGSNAIVLGNSGTANGTNSFAVGLNSIAQGNNSIAIGVSTLSGSTNSIAIGSNALVENLGIAIGAGVSVGAATGTGVGGIAIGTSSQADTTNNSSNSIAIGSTANAESGGIAIGNGAGASGVSGIAIGTLAVAGNYCVAIGGSNTAVSGVGAQYGIAIAAGTLSVQASGSNSLVIAAGHLASLASGSNSIVLGYGTAGTANQVVINGTTWVNGISGGGTGSVTSISTGSGLTGGPITNAGTISTLIDGLTLVYTSGTIGVGTSIALAGSPTTTTQGTSDNSTKVATTAYVTTAITNAIAGVNPAVAVQAATTTTLTFGPTYSNGATGIGATLTAGTNGALVIDGYTVALNDRVLIKNQGTALQNGVYTVTQLGTVALLPYILTRALDYDQPSDINNTGAIPVTGGTTNLDTTWVLTSKVTNVGTDSLTFTQFSLNPTTIQTNALANTNIWVGNSGGTAAAVAMSGDATLANTGALTLATVNSNVGTFGNTTNIPQITVNAKGLITAISNTAITYGTGSVTSVAAGAGLSGGPVTTTGTLTLDLTRANTWTGAATFNAGLNIGSKAIEEFVYANGTTGTAQTIAFNNGNIQTSTISGNVTYTFTPPTNPGRFSLFLNIDGTGGYTISLPTIKYQGGSAPTWSTSANSINILSVLYDGTTYFGVAGTAFA